MPTFAEFLADVAAERCWLVEIDALPIAPLPVESAAFGDGAFCEFAFCEDAPGNHGGPVTLAYSSHGFTSRSTDTPASTWYDGRVGDDIHVIRRIVDREDGFGGLALCFAEVNLVNNDGELDELVDDYAIDGRAIRILVGPPAAARADFGSVFTGVVKTAAIGEQDVRLSLSDGSAVLEHPINRIAYAGTGGLEGGADLKGKPKPKAWGHVFNVPAPLVNSTLLIYQVHDGLVSDVPLVWDRQIALTKGADYASQTELETVAPSAGQFRVWKAGGCFRLGSTPAGLVTADALGDASGAGYINMTGDIVNRVLIDQALLLSAQIDAAAIAQLNVDAPAEVGIWTGTEVRSIGEVVGQLLAGVGAFGGISRTGLFTAAVIKAPSGVSAASYTEEDILTLEREPLPPAVDPLIWRARVAWQHNYAVQADLAAGVTAARRTFAVEPDRLAERSDSTVRSRRNLAREYGPTGNLYALEADADTEAVRLMGLWSVKRGMFRAELPPAALERDIGEAVTLTHTRFGFSAGKQARVLWHEVRGAAVILKVFA